MEIWIDGSGALLPGQTARIAVVFGDGRTEIHEVGQKTNLINALKTDEATEATVYSDISNKLRQLFKGKKDRLILFMLCKSWMEVSTVPLAIQKRIVQPPKFELVG